MKSVIAICSRNRIFEVKFLLGYLDSQINWQDHVLLVDSSDSFDIVEALQGSRYDFKLEVIQTRASLPHQRNTAIRHLLSHIKEDLIVHFIDDDVIPCLGYFSAQNSELFLNPSSLIGARDLSLADRRRWDLQSKLGIRAKPGTLSKNGLTSPPLLNSRHNMWTPGLAFSYRLDQHPNFWFDENIDFFGEDLDATLRFSRQEGEILLTENSIVLHLEGPRSGSKALYDAKEIALRIRSAHLYPELVRKNYLVTSLIFESLYILFVGMVTRKLTWQFLRNRLAGIRQILFFRTAKAISEINLRNLIGKIASKRSKPN